MMKLIAKQPILYKAKQYLFGDELPTSDEKMAEAWIGAGSACWSEEDEEQAASAKATAMTAQPGATGVSSTGNNEDLIGRIPESAEREKPKPRKRRTSKAVKK